MQVGLHATRARVVIDETPPPKTHQHPPPRVCNRHPTGIGREPAEGSGVAKQKPRQGDGARFMGLPLATSKLIDTTISQSVAQRAGDSQRSIKSRCTLPRGNTNGRR